MNLLFLLREHNRLLRTGKSRDVQLASALFPCYYNMHGRIVTLTPQFNPALKCYDCAQSAHFIVKEPVPISSDEGTNYDEWLWCGECDIGG